MDLFLQKSFRVSTNPLIFAPPKGIIRIWMMVRNPDDIGKRTKILDGAVAQLVEQRTENPCVGGSIPPHTTTSKLRFQAYC